MQTIETRYHGGTNFKGSRVSASCEAGRVTLPWDHGLDIEENHKAAAHALISKLGWYGRFAIGSTRRGYAFVKFGWTCGIDDSWEVMPEASEAANEIRLAALAQRYG